MQLTHLVCRATFPSHTARQARDERLVGTDTFDVSRLAAGRGDGVANT